MLDALITYLQNHPAFFLLTIALYGLVVGSFLNVVVYRLPVVLDRLWRTRSEESLGIESEAPPSSKRFGIVSPRSRCPHCQHPLPAWDNIPVVSYLLLRGKCRYCKQPISIRYPLVEILSAVLSMLTAWVFGVTFATIAALVLLWSLIALTFIDYDHQILPDAITLPFLWLGLLVNSFGLFTELHSAVIGAISGYLSLWLVFHGFRLITGKEGMGYGDFKLFAMLGAWLGWQMLPLTILLAALSGAIIGGLHLKLSGRGRDHPIPFGPFLCVSGWVALLWGDQLVHSYLQFAHLG